MVGLLAAFGNSSSRAWFSSEDGSLTPDRLLLSTTFA